MLLMYHMSHVSWLACIMHCTMDWHWFTLVHWIGIGIGLHIGGLAHCCKLALALPHCIMHWDCDMDWIRIGLANSIDSMGIGIGSHWDSHWYWIGIGIGIGGFALAQCWLWHIGIRHIGSLAHWFMCPMCLIGNKKDHVAHTGRRWSLLACATGNMVPSHMRPIWA